MSWDTYTLSNPVMELEFEGRPPTWIIVAFAMVGLVVALAVLVGYAFLLPRFVGFEASVLIGIAILILK